MFANILVSFYRVMFMLRLQLLLLPASGQKIKSIDAGVKQFYSTSVFVKGDCPHSSYALLIHCTLSVLTL